MIQRLPQAIKTTRDIQSIPVRIPETDIALHLCPLVLGTKKLHNFCYTVAKNVVYFPIPDHSKFTWQWGNIDLKIYDVFENVRILEKEFKELTNMLKNRGYQL